MKKTNCILIADTRERHVLRHEKELEGITLEVKQITIGDYVVLSPTGGVLAVIERKSLEDFSASLKDGRADNKSKLNAFRAQTGCRIIYIIEGPEFPKPDDRFGKIPYRFIQSSIFHLMIRDGVSILRTKDSLHTATTLSHFMASMDTLVYKMEGPEQNIVSEVLPALGSIPAGGGEEISENRGNISRNMGNTSENRNITSGNGYFTSENRNIISAHEDIIGILTKKQAKSDHDIVREMWSCFPGISVESADEYMKYWSLADIICGRIPRANIVNFKLASGRNIGKKAVSSLTGINKLIETRLISTIPGISASAAADITSEHPLHRLLSFPAGAIAICKVGKLKRNLGDERAKKLLHYFNYKYTAPKVDNTPPEIVVNIDDPEIAELLNSL